MIRPTWVDRLTVVFRVLESSRPRTGRQGPALSVPQTRSRRLRRSALSSHHAQTISLDGTGLALSSRTRFSLLGLRQPRGSSKNLFAIAFSPARTTFSSQKFFSPAFHRPLGVASGPSSTWTCFRLLQLACFRASPRSSLARPSIFVLFAALAGRRAPFSRPSPLLFYHYSGTSNPRHVRPIL